VRSSPASLVGILSVLQVARFFARCTSLLNSCCVAALSPSCENDVFYVASLFDHGCLLVHCPSNARFSLALFCSACSTQHGKLTKRCRVYLASFLVVRCAPCHKCLWWSLPKIGRASEVYWRAGGENYWIRSEANHRA